MYTPIVLTKNYAMYNEILKDRMEAANLLSEKLKKYKNSNSVVIAIPRVYPLVMKLLETYNFPCCSF
jgi:uncharacterized membrane protein YobD (UPF0266 family)